MKYQKINIEEELIKNEFNRYSIEDRELATIAIIQMFSLSNNKKKVLNGLEEIQKEVTKQIKALKKKAIKNDKAYYRDGKEFDDYKIGIKETILENHPEYFRKNKRKYFTWN
tara:strand:- start:287 stop:622 length:336 start_codon:yes stop_codon:yes gene_type:complete